MASLTDRYRAAQIADWWQYLAHEGQWPLITQKRARQQERNAFEIGVDVGRSGNVRGEES